jgi:uncharacterized OB-fold protein
MIDAAARVLDARIFWEPDQVRAGEPTQLAISRCRECGRCEFLAREYCPACDGTVERAALSEHATLAGYTAVMHQPPDTALEVPYVVGVAEFREGVSILGLLVGVAVEDLAPGLPVRTIGWRVGDAVGFAFDLAAP